MDSRDCACRDYKDIIPLSTKKDVQRLLTAIWEPFVQKADIFQDGLYDALVSRGVINDSDKESLCGIHNPTRSDRARLLLDILRTISPQKFMERALPVLCEKVGFIIPAKFWKADSLGKRQSSLIHPPEENDSDTNDCTRCSVVRRVRLPDMADLMVKLHVIDLDINSQLTRHHRIARPNWDTLFSAFKNLSPEQAELLQPAVAELLSKHCLLKPDNLRDVMLGGFQCQCPPRGNTSGRVDSLREIRLRLQYEDPSRWSDASITFEEDFNFGDLRFDQDPASHHHLDDTEIKTPLHPDKKLLASLQAQDQVQVSPHKGNASGHVGATGIPVDLTPEFSKFKHENHSHPSKFRDAEVKEDVPTPLSRQKRAHSWTERKSQGDFLSRRSISDSGRSKHMSLRKPAGKSERLVCELVRELTGDKVCHDADNPARVDTQTSAQCAMSDPHETAYEEDQTVSQDKSAAMSLKLTREVPVHLLRQDAKRVYTRSKICSPTEVDSQCDSHNDFDGVNATKNYYKNCASAGKFNFPSPDSRSTATELSAEHNTTKLPSEHSHRQSSTPESQQAIDVNENVRQKKASQNNNHADRPDPVQSGHLESGLQNGTQSASSDTTLIGDIEAAKENSDLESLCQYVEIEVSVTYLDDLLKRAVIVVATTREKIRHLIVGYLELEKQYTLICDTAEMVFAQPLSLDPDNPLHFDQLLEECQHIVCLCEDMLVRRKAFILCNIYLSTLKKLTTEATRSATERVARDALVLMGADVQEVHKKLNYVKKYRHCFSISRGLFETLERGVHAFLSGF